MSRLFISHSAHDSFEALAFHDWLLSEGWSDEDVFIDLHDVGAGARWKEALNKANERCEAVVLLASPTSLASTECRLEIRMAEDYGKEIIVAILHLLTPEDEGLGVYRERQIVDLSLEPRDATFTVEHRGQRKAVAFSNKTLRSIKARLDQLGISPNSFSWRPANLEKASPYPGFEGFTQNEAALFFGRAGDIARGLAEIRRLRRLGTGQVLVVQAASGAGKSSFLKAGLWPRLLRDPDFLPVGIVRPATGILTGEQGVGRQLAAFFATHRVVKPAAEIHKALSGDLDQAAEAFARLINEAAELGLAIQRLTRPDAPIPTPLFAVDQAEELFAAADHEESQRFLYLVASILAPERRSQSAATRLVTPPLFLWTIRADSVDTLLHATDDAGLKAPQPFLLPPIPRDAYREIIEAPITVANQAGMRVSIDPLLVNALVESATGGDALPLLAFTLRQLLAENRAGSAARLTLEQFQAAGGMNGILGKRLAAAQRAAASTGNELRRLFIPHLATWDTEAVPPAAKRLVADEARLISGDRAGLKRLADALVEERLLTRSGTEQGIPTLEVAHEALLRLPPLSDWLAEDREFLVWRDRLAAARAGYEANARGLLVGRELQIARDWTEQRPADDIAANDRAFIDESVAEEGQRRSEEEQREQQRQAAELEAAEARRRTAEAEAKAADEKAKAAAEREAATRRIAKRTKAGLIAALMLAIAALGAGGYAWVQKQAADKQTKVAEDATKQAEARAAEIEERKRETDRLKEQAQRTESGLLATTASKLIDEKSHGDAGSMAALTIEALDSEGLPSDRPFVAEAERELRRALRALHEQVTLAGHTDSVRSAAFNYDGTRIVTASEDGTARIWDAKTGKEQLRLEGGSEAMTEASFSRDGLRVVTASRDNTARVWDAMSGKEIARFDGHTEDVVSAAFSPDGKRVVTASDDVTVRIWDSATGQEQGVINSQSYLRRAVFNTDGTRVLTLSTDGAAQIWDAAGCKQGATAPECKPLTTTRFDTSSFQDANFSADGANFVTAHQDGSVNLWDFVTGKVIVRMEGHTGYVRSAAFSADGKMIATGADDTIAKVWEVPAQRELASSDAASGPSQGAKEAESKELARFEGHMGAVWNAAFSRDGKQLVTSSSDFTARVWRVESGDTLPALPPTSAQLWTIAFSKDASKVLTSGSDGKARIWDSATRTLVRELEGHTAAVSAASFSDDGSWVLTASEDGTARIWDAATGAEKARLEGGTEAVRLAVFSPDASRVLTASADQAIRLWDVQTVKEIARLEGHTDAITSAVFTRDGARIITAGSDNTARIWDAKTGNELRLLTGHYGTIWTVALSPDGRHVVTASSDASARIWDMDTGALVRMLGSHTDYVRAAAYSPDSSRIVTASDDKTARIWDAATGKELTRLEHTDYVRAAAFNHDGSRIATASDDKTVRIWEVDTGKELDRLDHALAVESVAFSGDDEWLATTSSGDGSAFVWRVRPGVRALVEHAKSEVTRCLTPEQRAQYFVAEAPPAWCLKQRLWPYDAASSVVRANRFLGDKNADRAVAEADLALERAEPGTPGTWVRRSAFFARGKAHELAGNTDAAFADFQKAQDLGEGIFEYFLSEALNLQYEKKTAESIAVYDRAIAWSGNAGAPANARTRALFARGMTYDRLGDLAKADADFEAVGAAMATDVVDYYVAKAQENDAEQPTAEAFSAYDRAVTWSSREGIAQEVRARTLFARGKAFERTGQQEKASADFAAAGPGAVQDIVSYYVEMAASRQGEAAKAALDAAVTWSERDGATPFEKALSVFARGRMHHENGHPAEAAADFEAAGPLMVQQIVELYVTEARTLSTAGNTEAGFAAYDNAVAWSSRAGADATSRAEMLFARGMAYDTAGQPEKAKADFEAAGPEKVAGIIDYYTSAARNLSSDDPATEGAAPVTHDKEFAAYDEAVAWASRAGAAPDARPTALVERGKAYDRYGISDKATADFEAAGPTALESIVEYYVSTTYNLKDGPKVVESLAAAEAAVHWASRSGVKPEILTNAIFARGTALRANKRPEDALEDFRQAEQRGNTDATSWIWGCIMDIGYATEQANPAAALTLALPYSLDLSEEDRKRIGVESMRGHIARITYPVSGLYWRSALPYAKPPAQCDLLAGHPNDPMHVGPGVKFDDMKDADAVIAACSKDLEAAPNEARFLLQRARGHSKAAEEAAKKEDTALAEQHTKQKFADLKSGMEKGYPFAFNNQAYSLANGEGIEKDSDQATNLYMQTFGLVAQCCVPSAMRELLKSETQLDPAKTLRVVEALTSWSARIGNPEAHVLLAELARDRRLAAENGPRFAYEHWRIAAKLFTAQGKQSEAAAAEKEAAALTDLSEADKSLAAARVETFKPVKPTDNPPWIH